MDWTFNAKAIGPEANNIKLGITHLVFCPTMLCAAYAVMRWLTVCVSVTFVSCVKTNKHIKNFSPAGSHVILVFSCQSGWQYSDGNPANGGVECKWGRQKSRFWAHILSPPHVLTLQTRSPVDHSHRLASYDTSLVVTVSGGVDCGRRRRNIYDKKPQRNAKDNRSAHNPHNEIEQRRFLTSLKFTTREIRKMRILELVQGLIILDQRRLKTRHSA